MRIFCFGDSNTFGYDPRSFFGGRYPAENRWTDLLARHTGLEVVNAGLNGREIPGRAALPPLSDADLLVVMLGTNDLLQGADAAVRMEAFLEHLPHRKTLLVSPPPMQRGAWVDSDEMVENSVLLADRYRALAAKQGIPFVDTSSWDIGLCFDGVHFTEAGHRRFAEKLAEFLQKSGLTLPLRHSLY